MLKKKEVYEYKRVEKQVFWRIHNYYCMLKLARLESVRVPLSGKRPTNMAQECTFIFKLPHALHLSGQSLEGATRG